MKNALLLLLLFILYKPVLGQPTGPEITLHYGFIFAGSGHSILHTLEDAGFDQRSTVTGVGSFADNLQIREEAAVQIGVAFPVKSNYKAKGPFNYRDTIVQGNSSDFGNLTMETSCLSLAAIGYVPFIPPLFRLGLGPAYHQVKASPVSEGVTLADKKFSEPGFILEGGFSTPANKRFFADLQVQYFYVGSADAGTYTIRNTNSSGNTVSKTISFGNTKFSSLFFSLGAGFRFRKV